MSDALLGRLAAAFARPNVAANGRQGLAVVTAYDALVRTRVFEGLCSFGAPAVLRDESDIASTIIGCQRCVLLIGSRLGTVRSSISFVSRLRNQYPHLPIVLCLDERDPAHAQLHRFARAGVDDLVKLDAGDFVVQLRRTVGNRLGHLLPQGAANQIGGYPDGRSLTPAILGWILRNGYRNLKVEHVSRWFRCDRGTLNRTVRRGGLGPISDIIRFARFFHLALMLDMGPTSATYLTRELQFRSLPNLWMFVRRMSGLTLRELQQSGPIEVAADLVNRGYCRRQ